MQLHTGGKDKEEQKASFNIAKAKCKKPRQTKRDKRQSNNQERDKVAKENS